MTRYVFAWNIEIHATDLKAAEQQLKDKYGEHWNNFVLFDIDRDDE